nr:hypothetical protein [Pandoravirus aubagnensis]
MKKAQGKSHEPAAGNNSWVNLAAHFFWPVFVSLFLVSSFRQRVLALPSAESERTQMPIPSVRSSLCPFLGGPRDTTTPKKQGALFFLYCSFFFRKIYQLLPKSRKKKRFAVPSQPEPMPRCAGPSSIFLVWDDPPGLSCPHQDLYACFISFFFYGGISSHFFSCWLVCVGALAKRSRRMP